MVWLLVMSTGVSGCALRHDANVVPDPQSRPAVQVRLDNYPLGTHVRLRLASGERVEGVLGGIDAENVSVQPTLGEPPRVIARASIVEASAVSTGNSGVRRAGAWVLIGVVAAAGALLTLYLLAVGGCAVGVVTDNCP